MTEILTPGRAKVLLAARYRHAPERVPEARRDLVAANLASHIRKEMSKTALPLTEEQFAQLALLLHPSGGAT